MSNLTGRPPLGLKADKPERGTAAAKAYMARVKQLPCVICQQPPPSDAHHVCHDRLSQAKSSDFDTIPLCKVHHQNGPDAIHNNKRQWRERYGPDHGYIEAVRKQLGRD